MDKWLDTLVDEKGWDIEDIFEVKGPSGLNLIPLGVVIEHIKIAPKAEQWSIKHELVRLDLYNGPMLGYLGHLAKAIAA